MRLCIIGESFAPTTFKKVWPKLGFQMVDTLKDAELVFFSWDTAIDPKGNREQENLRGAIKDSFERISVPLILTSQVTPGFTRSLGIPIYNMAETLRIKDAEERALNPDYFVFGCRDGLCHPKLTEFVKAFGCPFFVVSYEEAEFSKIAVNMTLASQVDNANRLSKAAEAVGADWEKIAYILGKDKRIGPESYRKPGRWQDSQHLLRDAYTLKEIEDGQF